MIPFHTSVLAVLVSCALPCLLVIADFVFVQE